MAGETREFHAFTLEHGLTFAVCAALTVVLIALGLSARRRGTEHSVARVWGWIGVAVNVWSWIYWLAPANFDLKKSMPLELCDIACIVAPLSLMAHRRIFASLIFFWGIGLSSQAFVTPVLTDPFPTQRFWLFWALHLVIVATAFYQVIVRKYRPTLKDLLIVIAVSTAWVSSMFALDMVIDANYGFVGNVKTERPTAVDILGAWPRRVFLMGAIVIGLFTALWAIFRSRRPA
ncbi:MAG: TIGR02206 family membrane protein [Phycisphaerales bacterium]